MSKVLEEITADLAGWIAEQRLFFVATAPLARDGHVNTSPKGLDCFRVITPKQVAYLDVTGSGAETIAHLRENGRIVLMFCAFSGPPKIVRFHGTGRVVTKTMDEWPAWRERFPEHPSTRSIVVVDVTRVSTSCGFGVPKMDFVEDRDTMYRWAESKGPAALPVYRIAKNAASIDGLPALDERDA